jgi:hypothetical protein
LIRSYLKIRIFVRDLPQRSAGQEREAEDQSAPSATGSSTRILKYVEDLRRGLTADIGRKGFFEMASIFSQEYGSCPLVIEA